MNIDPGVLTGFGGILVGAAGIITAILTYLRNSQAVNDCEKREQRLYEELKIQTGRFDRLQIVLLERAMLSKAIDDND